MTKNVLVDIQLEGFEELSKAFNKIDRDVKRRILSRAMKEGAEEILFKTIKYTPVDEGLLLRSLHVKRSKRSRENFGWNIQTGTAAELNIKETKNRGYYPFTVEYGSRKLRRSPQPFMRRGLAEGRLPAINAIARELEKSLKRLAATIARKKARARKA